MNWIRKILIPDKAIKWIKTGNDKKATSKREFRIFKIFFSFFNKCVNMVLINYGIKLNKCWNLIVVVKTFIQKIFNSKNLKYVQLFFLVDLTVKHDYNLLWYAILSLLYYLIKIFRHYNEASNLKSNKTTSFKLNLVSNKLPHHFFPIKSKLELWLILVWV